MSPLQKILATVPLFISLNGCAVYPKQSYYPGHGRGYAVERNYYLTPQPYGNRVVIKRDYYGYPTRYYPRYNNYQPHYEHDHRPQPWHPHHHDD